MPARSETTLTETHTAPFAASFDDSRDGARRSWRDLLRPFVLRHRRVATVLATLGIAAFSYIGAVMLRFDGTVPYDLEPLLVPTLGAIVCCKLVAFWWAGLFTGWWRHVSIRDVEDIARGNVLGSLLFLCAMVFGTGLDGFPRSVFLIDLMLCTAATGGIRVALRLVRERRGRALVVRRIDTLALIVGAGSAGIRLLEEIESRPTASVGVVGFLDDDPGKRDDRIAARRCWVAIDDLPGAGRRRTGWARC